MKHKDEAFFMFKWNKVEVKTQFGMKLMYLRLDNGAEYKSIEFVEFYQQESVSQHFTTPHTPQQNSVVDVEPKF